jgi:hypothetical protein
MSSGLEHQKQIHETLKEFEAAIVKREKRFFGNEGPVAPSTEVGADLRVTTELLNRTVPGESL